MKGPAFRRLTNAARAGIPLPPGSLASGGGLLVNGIATYVFLALSRRTLGETPYAAFAVLWSLVFILGLGLSSPWSRSWRGRPPTAPCGASAAHRSSARPRSSGWGGWPSSRRGPDRLAPGPRRAAGREPGLLFGLLFALTSSWPRNCAGHPVGAAPLPPLRRLHGHRGPGPALGRPSESPSPASTRAGGSARPWPAPRPRASRSPPRRTRRNPRLPGRCWPPACGQEWCQHLRPFRLLEGNTPGVDGGHPFGADVVERYVETAVGRASPTGSPAWPHYHDVASESHVPPFRSWRAFGRWGWTTGLNLVTDSGPGRCRFRLRGDRGATSRIRSWPPSPFWPNGCGWGSAST